MRAHLPETTKGGCSSDLSPQSTTLLLGELGGSREPVGLGNLAKLSVILWGGFFLFPTCCPAFQQHGENETFGQFIQIFCASHDCFIQ